MKVYLDDTRSTPEGWIRTYWPEETIALLERGGITELSLDHDLGDDGRGTGYDVLTWLERRIFDNAAFPLPKIYIHSANPVGVLRMRNLVARLEEMKKNG